ncbi:hypothetical protein [Ruminococcus difficilis]|uniref:Uncharacterized protein n=1 Tax=Ruminococcus difficilis TaxID=2763069 RepID=A0A935C426_9FIRM|nr:hypothetical protein [Ruminococcus difficilis]MBK6089327.1 hypothetical protein [Ruminococcus difficilis]
MNFNHLWETYKEKCRDIRPFLRTKIGSRLAIAAILDFIILFFAPLMHGFVGTALFGCVTSAFLILFWRKNDREHAIVPAVILCIPMLLDMVIYHDLAIVVGFLVSIVAVLLAALSPWLGFFDRITDLINSLLVAGALCVGTVVFACIMLMLVNIAWWILCIIAFFIVVAVFMGVVFSTAAYTASDGRRQANKKRRRELHERDRDDRYRDYQPPKRDNRVYNLDDDDFRDVE